MRQILNRAPSASLIISTCALVVALSSTAIAAVHLVNGDSLIQKHSLSGNRLRRKTLTGTQINLKDLGKVPAASTAGFANLAGHATTANSATNATNATDAANASTVGGDKLATLTVKIPKGTVLGQIYGADGLSLVASCDSGGDPVLGADESSTAQMNVQGTSFTGSSFGGGANGFTSSPVDLTGGNTQGSGTLTYGNASQQTVTVNYSFNPAPTLGGSFTGCLLTATAIASS